MREHCPNVEKSEASLFKSRLRTHLKNIQQRSKNVRAEIDDCCFDLIEKCLRIDPRERISAKDAIEHPWFQALPLPNEKEMP